MAKAVRTCASIIEEAILDSPQGRLKFNEITEWIAAKMPAYTSTRTNWRSTVRHNLTIRERFKKVARLNKENSRGHYWTLNQEQNKQDLPAEPGAFLFDETPDLPPSGRCSDSASSEHASAVDHSSATDNAARSSSPGAASHDTTCMRTCDPQNLDIRSNCIAVEPIWRRDTTTADPNLIQCGPKLAEGALLECPNEENIYEHISFVFDASDTCNGSGNPKGPSSASVLDFGTQQSIGSHVVSVCPQNGMSWEARNEQDPILLTSAWSRPSSPDAMEHASSCNGTLSDKTSHPTVLQHICRACEELELEVDGRVGMSFCQSFV